MLGGGITNAILYAGLIWVWVLGGGNGIGGLGSPRGLWKHRMTQFCLPLVVSRQTPHQVNKGNWGKFAALEN
ncbi:MAG: hypothetical protein CM15mP83_5230 [Flavobacteriaceae bacterium]|nr:MAG: hypothetical protein CM15mP83_5230 [Flavobacteriaceae bacterium]